MFVILDPCQLGVGPAPGPGGGITLRIGEIGGLPSDVSLAIPIGAEAATSLIEEANNLLNKPQAFDLADLKKETDAQSDTRGAPGPTSSLETP